MVARGAHLHELHAALGGRGLPQAREGLHREWGGGQDRGLLSLRKITTIGSSPWQTYKCQFCCSEALFFCFGTTHFCSTVRDETTAGLPPLLLPSSPLPLVQCHDRPGEIQDMKTAGRLAHCPAGPMGKQLPGTRADCSLKCKHPEPGEEFVLGEESRARGYWL